MKQFFWTGISSKDRLVAIDEVTNLINGYGVLLNHQLFSDISISLVIEVEAKCIQPLWTALSEIMSVESKENTAAMSGKDCTIYLNITFTQGKGDLIRDVPSIPG